MSIETKLERAKRISLKKFLAIKEETIDLLDHASNVDECGFCQEYKSCSECQGKTQCAEMESNFTSFVEVGLNYLENELIPYLSPPEEEGEKEK